jgi:purine-cytosine permease-like protein
LLYLVAAVVLVPLNWYGVSQMHWIQKWTVPLFFIGLIWLVIDALGKPVVDLPSGGVTAKTLLPALAAVLGNVAIWVLLVGDFARFARKEDRRRVVTLTVIVAMGGEFLFLAMLGGLLAGHTGSANPGAYAVGLMGVPGLLWIVVTQLRVQEGNYYSGSLSMVNFSARVLHWVPGRRTFVILVAVFSFLLAQLKIVDHLTDVLTFMAIFLFAWIGTMVYSLVARRHLLARGEVWVEHRRGYLRNWGWPAVAGLVIGSAVGAPLALSGSPEPYGGFLGIALAFVLAPAIFALIDAALGRNPQYLIARVPDPEWRDTNERTDVELEAPAMQVTCGTCGSHVMKPDACTCPVAPGGVICSACCQAHSTCGDVCKTPQGLLKLADLAASDTTALERV